MTDVPDQFLLPHFRIRLAVLSAGIAVAFLSLDATGVSNGRAPLAAESHGAGPSATLGSVEGRVVYTPDSKRPWQFGRYYVQRKTGNLAEAVVCLQKVDDAPETEPRKWEVDQKDYRFVPETTSIRKGDEVVFTNSDPQIHNVNSTSPLQGFDITVRPGGKTSVVFKRAGGVNRPLILGCKFHSVMKAWIYVFDHPFHQVTGVNGAFRLSGIPPGEYRLQMVHPSGSLEWARLIKVAAGETTEQDIQVSPDDKAR